MGKHAHRHGRGWLDRITHHPRVARWVQARDRVVLGAVGFAVGLTVLVGCGSGGPRQLTVVPVLERLG